jgi:hypothetical protein
LAISTKWTFKLLPKLGLKHNWKWMNAMTETEDAEGLEAIHGEKMIEVKLRFWTNNIAPERGKILPKHAWTHGVVRVERNNSHGIETNDPLPFNSLLELGGVIEEALIKQGIVLHPSRKMRKYLSDGS